MSTVVLGGTGAVAVRAARQLLDSPGVEHVLFIAGDAAHGRRVADAFGDRAGVIRFEPGDPLPPCAVVVSARPSDEALAQAALDARVPFVSCDDDQFTIFRMLDLADAVAEAGLTFVLGAGLAPGIADLLVRHAVAELDPVDEIRIARAGAGGPMSLATLKRDLRSPGVGWSAGEYRTWPGPGDELVWFPEPLGAVECAPAVLGLRLLVDAFRQVNRISVVAGNNASSDRRRFARRRTDDDEWGGARVEVWGSRDGHHGVIVYGVVDRTAVAAGTMLAVAALHVAGIGTDALDRPGVHGVGALFEPVSVLAELSKRGVRAAKFEGAPVG